MRMSPKDLTRISHITCHKVYANNLTVTDNMCTPAQYSSSKMFDVPTSNIFGIFHVPPRQLQGTKLFGNGLQISRSITTPIEPTWRESIMVGVPGLHQELSSNHHVLRRDKNMLYLRNCLFSSLTLRIPSHLSFSRLGESASSSSSQASLFSLSGRAARVCADVHVH